MNLWKACLRLLLTNASTAEKPPAALPVKGSGNEVGRDQEEESHEEGLVQGRHHGQDHLRYRIGAGNRVVP
jgi:hypothetical protein